MKSDTIFHYYYTSSYILPSSNTNSNNVHNLNTYNNYNTLYRSCNIPKWCYNDLTFNRFYKFNNNNNSKIFDLVLNNNICYASTSLGNIHVLSPIMKAPIYTLDNSQIGPNSHDIGSEENGVNCMRIINNYSLLTGSEEGSIKLWDLRMRKVILHNHDHQDGLKNIFHYRDDLFLSAAFDNTVRLFSIDNPSYSTVVLIDPYLIRMHYDKNSNRMILTLKNKKILIVHNCKFDEPVMNPCRELDNVYEYNFTPQLPVCFTRTFNRYEILVEPITYIAFSVDATVNGRYCVIRSNQLIRGNTDGVVKEFSILYDMDDEDPFIKDVRNNCVDSSTLHANRYVCHWLDMNKAESFIKASSFSTSEEFIISPNKKGVNIYDISNAIQSKRNDYVEASSVLSTPNKKNKRNSNFGLSLQLPDTLSFNKLLSPQSPSAFGFVSSNHSSTPNLSYSAFTSPNTTNNRNFSDNPVPIVPTPPVIRIVDSNRRRVSLTTASSFLSLGENRLRDFNLLNETPSLNCKVIERSFNEITSIKSMQFHNGTVLIGKLNDSLWTGDMQGDVGYSAIQM